MRRLRECVSYTERIKCLSCHHHGNNHRVLTPPPRPVKAVKAGTNHFEQAKYPLLPIGIGVQYSQTISKLSQAALLRRCELPPLSDSAELTQ